MGSRRLGYEDKVRARVWVKVRVRVRVRVTDRVTLSGAPRVRGMRIRLGLDLGLELGLELL
jgi:hypothetical protein